MKSIKVKDLSITCDISYLYRRWIACYMLYDYNYRHADNCFSSNQPEMIEEAYTLAEKRISENTEDQDPQSILNDCYCEVLADSIESWVLAHMDNWNKSRSYIETRISKIAYELELEYQKEKDA